MRMATATAPSTTATLPAGIRGGAYAATQNPDGSWNVLDVPVFAAHERHGKKVDQAWLEGAVRRAAELHASNYVAPLHVGHHPDGDVQRAGYFLPKRVEQRAFAGGKPLPVVVADLLAVPADVFQEIKAGRLPYVSVEVADLNKPEISSLALLEDEAPFFKFPLLTIGQESSAETPLVASARARFLFSDGRGPVEARYMAAEAADLKSKLLKAFTSALDSAFGETPAASTDSAGASTGAAPAGQPATAQSPAEQLGAAEAPAAAPPAPIAVAAHQTPAPLTYADLARIEGRLAAIETEGKKAAAARALEGTVDAAARELATYGVAGDEVRAQIRKYAESGGEAAVKAYVEGVKGHATPRPPETWTGELPAPRASTTAVAAYAAGGPDRQRAAERMAQVYAAMPPSMRGRFTLESFLEHELGKPTAPGAGRN